MGGNATLFVIFSSSDDPTKIRTQSSQTTKIRSVISVIALLLAKGFTNSILQILCVLFWILLSYFLCQYSAALYWHWSATWSVWFMIEALFLALIATQKSVSIMLVKSTVTDFCGDACYVVHYKWIALCISWKLFFSFLLCNYHALLSHTQTHHILKQVFLLTVRHMLTSHIWRYQVALL